MGVIEDSTVESTRIDRDHAIVQNACEVLLDSIRGDLGPISSKFKRDYSNTISEGVETIP
jgi:hypothetical protein